MTVSNPAAPHASAMLLAAGRGERMRPLTDTTPKPLLRVRGKPLLQWHLEALAQAGVPRCVINTAWLGEQLEDAFGAHFALQATPHGREALSISYSPEGRDFGAALETAGGIVRALPSLDDMFWVAAGDVVVPGWKFALEHVSRFAAGDMLAHLWLVPNPAHNPRGDFGLSDQGLALNLPKDDPAPRYTFSTIGLYRKALFESPWCGIASGNPNGVRAPLAPLLRRGMDAQRISAELYSGEWADIGTPQRLAEINAAQTPVRA